MSARLMSGCLTAVALGVAGLLFPQASLAAKVDGPKISWDLSTWGAKRAATAGAEELARLVGEATDGNFTIKIHYGEVLGPIREALDALNIGAFQMTYTVPAYTPGKLPTFEGLSLPFLPAPTPAHMKSMRAGFMGSAAPHRDAARWGVSLITVQQNPPTQMLGKGRPPRTLNDLKGLRVRAIGGDAAAMKLIGAVPQNMPLTEVYGGLERGLLDAAASVNSSLAAYKLQELANWYTTNFAVSLPGGVILASAKAMDSLPPQYRKLILDSVPAVNDHWMKVDLREDEVAIEAFKAKGLSPVTFPESDLEALRQQVRPIWDAWVEQLDKLGYNGKELLQVLLDSARKGGAS